MILMLLLVNLLKKTDNSTKINEIENKITSDHDHDKLLLKLLKNLIS